MFFNDQELNSVIISIIWGLGLACLFRKACKNNCIVINAPSDINSYIEHIDNKCYRFTKNNIEC